MKTRTKYIVAALAALAIISFYTYERQPRTVEDCILKYAKPGIDSELGKMAIAACASQVDEKDQDSQQRRYLGNGANATAGQSKESSFDFVQVLAYVLTATMVIWGVWGVVIRFAFRRSLGFGELATSFLVTWLMAGGVALFFGGNVFGTAMLTALVVAPASLVALNLLRGQKQE